MAKSSCDRAAPRGAIPAAASRADSILAICAQVPNHWKFRRNENDHWRGAPGEPGTPKPPGVTKLCQ